MTSGGARTVSGPAPDPHSLKSRANSSDWVTLPGDGRKGRAPSWPLPTMASQSAHYERILEMYEDVDLAMESDAERKRIEKLRKEATLFILKAHERDKRESVLWRREWRRPQATEWEKDGQVDEVALYVRRLAEAEVSHSTVALSTLIRQMREDLGISATGMARHHWKIGNKATAGPAATVSSLPSGPVLRPKRLRAVPSGDGA